MAYALATRLERAVKASGTKHRMVSGWRSRGHGTMGAIRSIMCHHTAGPRAGNTPSLNVVAYGRAGLRGPLSQLFLARDGTVYLVAAGLSYHAGTVNSSNYTNSHSIGIEAENTGLSNDQPWPTAQMVAYAMLCRALADEFNLPVSRVIGHKEAAPSRKIDPTFSMPAFRTTVSNIRLGTKPGTPKPKEGLFGMAHKAADDRTERQAIAKGKELSLRTRRANTNKMLASMKNGETVLINAQVTINGMREGQIAEVWVRVGEYVAKTKKTHTRHNHRRQTVIGRAGGGDVHALVSLVDKVGLRPKHGGDLRAYLIVKNVDADECVVTNVKYQIVGD